MTVTTSTESPGAHAASPRRIHVEFNKMPITLPERHMTGIEIKEEAISQGIAIEVNFPLSVQRHGKFEGVGDTEEVNVRGGDKFRAVPPDDNS